MIQVLIVEDDPMVAQINKEYIKNIEHFTVQAVAENGEEALAYLKQHKTIDLLILDVFMPKMNGIDFLQEIRQEFNQVDVIFVTAAKDKQIIQRALQLGAVDYLIKPFTFDRIKIALQKYLQRYKLFQTNVVLNQDNLDELFENNQPLELPKGIHPITLQKIQDAIRLSSTSILDAQAIAKSLGISMVTLRLYLDYLVDCKKLCKGTVYGKVGRPKIKYHKKTMQ